MRRNHRKKMSRIKQFHRFDTENSNVLLYNHQVTLELFVGILALLKLYMNAFDLTLEEIGVQPEAGEASWITTTRDGIKFFYFLIINVRGNAFTSIIPHYK